jgi:hemoglobin
MTIAVSPASRRAPVHPGITEELIATQVDRFYTRIRADAVMAPHFEPVIGPDWGPHLRRMKDFWSSVTMMSGRYKGTPFQVHQRLPGLTPELFERWLSIWREVAREACPPDVAEVFIERAERIAASLQMGLFWRVDAPSNQPTGRTE